MSDYVDNLEEGDFLYQSDSELFLVVTEVKEESVLFSAHGWRNIGKERLEQYIEDDRSKIHQQREIEELVEEKADDDEAAQFEKLKELFEAYKDTDIVEDGPHSDFALEDQ